MGNGSGMARQLAGVVLRSLRGFTYETDLTIVSPQVLLNVPVDFEDICSGLISYL